MVFDTSPTIVPQMPPVVADVPATNPPQEAFALLNAQVPAVSKTPLPVRTERKVAKRAHTPGGWLIDRLQEQKRYPLVGSSIME